MQIIKKTQDKLNTTYTILVDQQLWSDMIKQQEEDIDETDIDLTKPKLFFGKRKIVKDESKILEGALDDVVSYVYKWFNKDFNKNFDDLVNRATWAKKVIEISREKLILNFEFENFPTTDTPILDAMLIPEIKQTKPAYHHIVRILYGIVSKHYFYPTLSRPAKWNDTIEVKQQLMFNNEINEDINYDHCKIDLVSNSGMLNLVKGLIGIKKGETRIIKENFDDDNDIENSNLCWKIYSYGVCNKKGYVTLDDEIAKKFMIPGI